VARTLESHLDVLLSFNDEPRTETTTEVNSTLCLHSVAGYGGRVGSISDSSVWEFPGSYLELQKECTVILLTSCRQCKDGVLDWVMSFPFTSLLMHYSLVSPYFGAAIG